MATHYIIGLGNPGDEYENTRHNAGRMCVESFASAADVSMSDYTKKPKHRYGKMKLGTHTVVLVQPDTFMNSSGHAAAHFVKSKKDAGNTVVIYDDLDLPFGTIKISFGRGSGGHNGVESIIKSLKTRDFARVRIGVSRASAKGVALKPKGEEKVLKFLLGTFTPDELKALKKVFKTAHEALTCLVTEGRDIAMTRFN